MNNTVVYEPKGDAKSDQMMLIILSKKAVSRNNKSGATAKICTKLK